MTGVTTSYYFVCPLVITQKNQILTFTIQGRKLFIDSGNNSVILVSFSYHSRAFPEGTSTLRPLYVIRDFTTAKSYCAISDVVCTEMNESSRTALECALPCEGRVKKTVKSL